MSAPSGSSHLRELFEAALVEYKQQTGIDLAKHTLAYRLQDCNSVEDITALLREQAQDFKKFQEKDKVLKPLKKVLTVLHLLSSVPGIAQHVGLVRPKALTDMQRLRPSSYSLSGP
jgi:STAND-like protein